RCDRRHQQPLSRRLPEPRHPARLADDHGHAAVAWHDHPRRPQRLLRRMRKRPVIRAALIAACLCVAPAILPAQETRIASDCELAQMERQAATAKDFTSQLSAHLNLGDLRLTRNETAAARGEYRKALDTADNERTAQR